MRGVRNRNVWLMLQECHMPYYVRMTTETDGLIKDPKPYPALSAAMQVAGSALKTSGATTVWIEDDDGKVCANTSDVKKHCGLS